MNKILQETFIDGKHKKVVTIIQHDNNDLSKEVRYEYDDKNDNTINVINGEIINAYNGNHKAIMIAVIVIMGFIIFGAIALI